MSFITDVLPAGVNSHQTQIDAANAIATDFVTDGVVGATGNTSGVSPATGAFAINAATTPNMTIDITAGVAYMMGFGSGVNQQRFRIRNTALYNHTINSNTSGGTRYDWVYLSLDETLLSAPNAAGDNVASIFVARSTSATSNTGVTPSNALLLGIITVANNATSITNGVIQDKRSKANINTVGSGKTKVFRFDTGANTYAVTSGSWVPHNFTKMEFTTSGGPVTLDVWLNYYVNSQNGAFGIQVDGTNYQLGTTPHTTAAGMHFGSLFLDNLPAGNHTAYIITKGTGSNTVSFAQYTNPGCKVREG